MKSTDQTRKENNRRGFIKSIMTLAGTVGLISTVKGSTTSEKPEMVKMLTPDGRLVEIEKSKIEKGTTAGYASNTEVREWMNSKNNI